MAVHVMAPIPKIDVLMEDFTNIETLIDNIVSDRETATSDEKQLGSFLPGI